LILFFPLKTWAPKEQNYFMDSWWQHCNHCLAHGHVPRFCSLELVEDGIRLVRPSVEQRCIITFLVKQKMKPEEIIRKLNAQCEEETEPCAGVCGWCNKFLEGRKEALNLPHAHARRTEFWKLANYSA
jgi:hypothetical protein